MKRKLVYLVSVCVMIGFQCRLSAQEQALDKNKKRTFTPEQLMQRQTNQMANTLMLDDATAAKFTPMYRNYLKELRECRTTKHKPQPQAGKKNGEEKSNIKPSLTDAEVEQMIKGRFAQSRKILDVREKYYNEFRKILSPKQILKIYQTERSNAGKLRKELERRKSTQAMAGKRPNQPRPNQARPNPARPKSEPAPRK